MIKSKEELREYLDADRVALCRKGTRPRFNDYIWKYEILLRKCEYYQNTSHNIFGKIASIICRYKRSRIGYHTGLAIPVNCVGKGLCIAHLGPIIINEQTRIGENCRIHVGVNIGADARVGSEAPTIGNNVYIAPGAKIFGKIYIADNIAIGANAVVNKTFDEPGISIAGVPAKKINNNGVKDILDT